MGFTRKNVVSRFIFEFPFLSVVKGVSVVLCRSLEFIRDDYESVFLNVLLFLLLMSLFFRSEEFRMNSLVYYIVFFCCVFLVNVERFDPLMSRERVLYGVVYASSILV